MRVLFVSNLYPPNVVGGYEKLCADVAAAFAGRGVAVTVLTSPYGGRLADTPGQVVHQALQLLVGPTIYDGFDGSAARRDAINRANLTALRTVAAQARPDRIFCWNLYGLDPSFLRGLIDTGVPVTAMLTDNWLAAMFNGAFVDWYFRSEVFRGDPADVPPRPPSPPIAFPCDAVFGAAYMRDFYAQAGIRFRDSRVVHNGVEQAVPPGAGWRDRAVSTVAPGTFSLLFAGRVVPLKGLRTAVEALPLLRDAGGPRVTLTVVGDDRDAAHVGEVRALAERLGVAADLRWQPPVAADALHDLFQAHDAYVFPSLYEPFSLTLILALAAGIPTTASDAGGNVEIVRDGETGLVFRRDDPADLARAVRRLRDDPAARARMAAMGREVAAGFTFARMVDGMLAFLGVGETAADGQPWAASGSK